jgi:energy-coupling factor transporter ATP-binding protein EcfA2
MSAAPPALIEAVHLGKNYGQKIAVEDASFQVHAGEIFGFLGPNGAGKTTTLKMLVGLINAAPVRPSHFLWAKYIVALLPTLAVGWLFAILTAFLRDIPLGDLGYIILVTGLCFAGLNGILLAFGVTGANLEAEEPRKMGLLTGAIFTMLCAILPPLALRPRVALIGQPKD